MKRLTLFLCLVTIQDSIPMQKAAQPSALQPASDMHENKATSLAYSDQDRLAIIEMARNLKYCHLLFPIANNIFKTSIKHALLDGAELMAEEKLAPNAPLTTSILVAKALANLSRLIKHSCPQKDFLDSIETLLEQIDDRYGEEAKKLLEENPNRLDKMSMAQLSYAVGNYEELTPKNLVAMVHGNQPAPQVLEENISKLSEEIVKKWHEDFLKNSPANS